MIGVGYYKVPDTAPHTRARQRKELKRTT